MQVPTSIATYPRYPTGSNRNDPNAMKIVHKAFGVNAL
jgi:hypothetical protein